MIEKMIPESVRERRRGGMMIWSEWNYGETFLSMLPRRADVLEYYGVEFTDPAFLEQWPYYMDGDLEPESDEFVRWAETHTWHEFESWEEAERWFDGEDTLHLRRGE